MIDQFVLNLDISLTEDQHLAEFVSKVSVKQSINFSTSGTTGAPKHATHSYDFLTQNIKIKPELTNAVWGLTYPSNKMAGSQVILQALLNNGFIVNLFGKPLSNIQELITKFNITHLSATPTFYRLLLAEDIIFSHVKQVTFGGEPLTQRIFDKVKRAFPNANITNVYASTEYGTLFASNNLHFQLSDKHNELIQIKDNEILVYSNGIWNKTGDIIEWIDENKFIIIGRDDTIINVGGFKVMISRVENAINDLPYVVHSRVFKFANSVLGNIVVADIVINTQETNLNIKHQIKTDLKRALYNYEIPTKINIVRRLDITSTNKVVRI